jgi:hypothetical protein
MFIAATVLGIILALAFAGAGGSKLAGVPAMRAAAAHLELPYSTFRWIGLAEVVAAVGIIVGLWRVGFGSINLAVLSGACLVILMIGAASMHMRAGDKPAQWAPAASLAVLTFVFVVVRMVSL